MKFIHLYDEKLLETKSDLQKFIELDQVESAESLLRDLVFATDEYEAKNAKSRAIKFLEGPIISCRKSQNWTREPNDLG